jgi:hypothetical protein
MNLPILKILVGAVVLFWERRVVLVRVLWAPILIGLILSLLSASLAGERGGGLAAVLLLVPLLFVTAILAVRAHRVYLLGSESVAELPPLSWSQTETRFLLATLSLGLAFLGLMFFAGMVFTLVGARPPGTLNPGAMLIALPAMYVIARLLPALPAIAVGDETGRLADAWRKAWASSRGNGTRVLAVCLLTPLAIKVLLELFAAAPIPGTAVISTLAGWAVMPAEVALLSLTYQALRSSEPETPQRLEQ